ncbi:MAG: nuclear transport factor 2 family protein [Chloroflexi bacterium]|nr:nuclear transport factor 2 family protein [Chloroflexota bacterium]
MTADKKTEAEVMSVWNKFNEAYARRDMTGLLALFLPDTVVIGTGADERRIGQDEIKMQVERDWSQSEAASFRWEWRSISRAGSVAWLAAEGDARIKVDGQEMSLPLRATAVLEQRAARWLLAQAHFSFPAAEQAEGESWPA